MLCRWGSFTYYINFSGGGCEGLEFKICVLRVLGKGESTKKKLLTVGVERGLNAKMLGFRKGRLKKTKLVTVVDRREGGWTRN